MAKTSDIPFVRPARVGNFKLWRSRIPMTVHVDDKGGVRRKEKVDVECINVSDLDGTWKVQIPSKYEMFAILNALYADFISDDAVLRERSGGIFSMLLGNMMYASTIGNGYYHRALEMVATCYAFPNVLDKKDERNKQLRKDAKALVDAFIAWRGLLDKTAEAGYDEEKEARRDDVAEQAQEILNKEEDAVEEEDRDERSEGEV